MTRRAREEGERMDGVRDKKELLCGGYGLRSKEVAVERRALALRLGRTSSCHLDDVGWRRRWIVNRHRQEHEEEEEDKIVITRTTRQERGQ